MDDPETRRRNFTVYTSTDAESSGEQTSPLDGLLNALRSAGLPETGIATAREMLVRAGVTDSLLRSVQINAEETGRRAAAWTRKNPRKVGGMAVIALLIGTFVIVMERRS